MAYVNGRIVFSKLKGFPMLDDGSNIQTQCFIDGAKEVVSLIGEYLDKKSFLMQKFSY